MNGKALRKAKRGKTVQEGNPTSHGQAVQALVAASVIVGAFLLIGFIVTPLCAQSYPNKPMRLIIPYAPGGTTDVLARIIGQKFAERLGQPVVPENHGGSGGNVGYEIASKARPDGYTILQCSSSITISRSLYKKLNYDLIKDFTPISLVAETSYVLIVRSSLPVNSVKELVEYARANPGKLNYGSTGIGATAQLATELFRSLCKINIIHVPYKGAGHMLIGLIGGEVDVLVIGPGIAMPGIQTGKVRVLAVMSEQRIPSMPDVPTIKEAGIDNCEVTAWYGILARAGTPHEIVNRLNAEWNKSAAMPDTKELMRKAGFEPLSDTPEHFDEFMKAETVRWAKVIKDANIPRIN